MIHSLSMNGGLRPANQSPRERSGRYSVAMRDDSADDRRGITLRALHEAPSAAWQVVRDDEAVSGDKIDVVRHPLKP